MLTRIASALTLAACLFGADVSDRFYSAIRNDDLAAVRALIKTNGPNVADRKGATPLMYACSAGSLQSLQLLLDARADVNARTKSGATALMMCSGNLAKSKALLAKGADVKARTVQGRTALIVAAANGDTETVRDLLARGADVNERDQETGWSPILAATYTNYAETARLLLDKGADPNDKDKYKFSVLMNAAWFANAPLVRDLLARGARVNDVCDPITGPPVKNGEIAIGTLTALGVAVATGDLETVRALIDAGARVNVTDVRGMTPLMLATAADHGDPRIVSLLLEKGADAKAKSKIGDDVAAWALKYRNPRVMAALGVTPKDEVAVLRPVAAQAQIDPRTAAAKGLALIQKTDSSFFETGGCVSCHSQDITAVAVAAARENGVPYDSKAAAAQRKVHELHSDSVEQPLLIRFDSGGGADQIGFDALAMHAYGVPPGRSTDAMVANLAVQQMATGEWPLQGIVRPPLEDGPFSQTARAIFTLSKYAPPARKPEMDARIARAAAWLSKQVPVTTEDATMQLLGLVWAKSGSVEIDRRANALKERQREDGGWSQTEYLASDAYATGETLYALHEAGMSPSDPVYRRGVAFLLRTQFPDGSWHVSTRAAKFQPYFQSGFPHDHDQWISMCATAWASAALAYAPQDVKIASAR